MRMLKSKEECLIYLDAHLDHDADDTIEVHTLLLKQALMRIGKAHGIVWPQGDFEDGQSTLRDRYDNNLKRDNGAVRVRHGRGGAKRY